METAHEPVLLREALEALAVRPGGFYVDGTVGLGGHAAAILAASAPGGRLLGVDRDGESLERARAALAAGRVRLVHADYRQLPELVGAERPDGILLDLGLSSLQLDSPERGFSFRSEGPLDMRMDRSGGETAAEVVNRVREKDLADLIYRFGEERASRRIARAILAARPIATTTALAEVVRRVVRHGRRGIDPATRTFQALRIHVNRELEGLATTLEALAHALAAHGRLVVIAFHSLEDREVKQTFRALDGCGFRLLTRKPIRPGPAEVTRNPRARSARLRALAREEAA